MGVWNCAGTPWRRTERGSRTVSHGGHAAFRDDPGEADASFEDGLILCTPLARKVPQASVPLRLMSIGRICVNSSGREGEGEGGGRTGGQRLR